MAVAQFRALRSEHHIATTFAVMEAEELGGMFVRGEIEHAFEKEKRALATWETLEDIDEGSLTARKRWKMIAERHVGETDWSRGVQYVRMWQAGNRVDYSPAIMRPIGDEDALLNGEDEDVQAEDLEYESESEDEGAGSGILTAKELDKLVENQFVGEDDSLVAVSSEENTGSVADTDFSVALEDVVVEDPKPRSEEAEFFNFTKKS